jgi:hypothetical protein
MSIVLSMTSSRNIEEVAIFLQKMQEANYDIVSFFGARQMSFLIDLTIQASEYG